MFGGLLVVLLFGLLFSSGFSVTGTFIEEVYSPQYTTLRCVERPGSPVVVSDDVSLSGRFLRCQNGVDGNYIPSSSMVYCEYELVRGCDSYRLYKCPVGLTNPDRVDSLCTKISGGWSDYGDKITVSSSGDMTNLFFDPYSCFTEPTLNLYYPSYGLEVRYDNGFVSPITDSCRISSYSDNSLAKDEILFYDDGDSPVSVVEPGVALNVVTARVKEYSAHLVDTDDGRGVIYITRPGYYYETFRSDDGTLFVDPSKEFFDGEIECVPFTPGCTSLGKQETVLEGTECGGLFGYITGYAPVEGGDELCLYECVNGKNVPTTDCISIPTEACPEGTHFSYVTGKCVDNADVDGGGVVFDWLFVGIVVVVLLLLIVLMVFIKRSMKR